MIGLIPAAGRGTRLSLPFSKELLPLLDKEFYYPIIQSSIETMYGVGINKIIIIVNYQKSDLMKFLGNGSKFGVQLIYVVQEEPTSLPQALLEAVKITDYEDILFLMPDTLILPSDFLKTFFNQINTDFSINLGCFRTERPHKFAMISEQKSIVNFIEEKNPKSKLKWMWGFWYWKGNFSQHIRDFDFSIKEDGEWTLSEVAEFFLNKRDIYSIFLKNYSYRDFGTYEEIHDYLKDKF